MESENNLPQLSAAENLTLPTTFRIFATKVPAVVLRFLQVIE